MTTKRVSVPDDAATLARIARGLRMVTASLPHLSGLAAAVRVSIDDGVPTMGIFASGRLVANRGFTARLSGRDLVFVLAHELLHLALRTHDRARGANHLEFNYAHDYIINDMLRHALGFEAIPAGGLDMPGAREKSAEEIIVEMRRLGRFNSSRTQVWEGEITTVEQVMGASRQAGPGRMGDVFDEAREREMFPDDVRDQADRTKAMRELAQRGAGLAKAMRAARGRGQGTGSEQRQVRALRGIYQPPWQVVLQRWMEGVAPAERSFNRASRRGAEREDVVLPGRQRSSMLLNVILDTSASMTDEIPHALGAIADFCEATGVDEIRVVQCDTDVTADAVLSPVELVDYEVKGYGGSDLTPALALFASDPRVTATVVITDGDIAYPQDPLPLAVLWVVPGDTTTFTPPYGRVVTMPKGPKP
jgi:predicted metal-dependent peptidase